MNRDTAAYKGFDFVRITPASGVANLSSAFTKQWAKNRHRPENPVVTRRAGPPADLSDLMLMLDMMVGGGVMDAVNEGQQLLQRKAQN
ncbi:hypothetical protein ACIPUD_37980 [Bradyrhizobium sp. CAR08]